MPGLAVLPCAAPAPCQPCCADKPALFLPAVIKDFCKLLGVDNKQVQGVIRLAKKNGEKLGFLA